MTDTANVWPQDLRVQDILDIVVKETGISKERLLPRATIISLDIASLSRAGSTSKSRSCRSKAGRKPRQWANWSARR